MSLCRLSLKISLLFELRVDVLWALLAVSLFLVVLLTCKYFQTRLISFVPLSRHRFRKFFKIFF